MNAIENIKTLLNNPSIIALSSTTGQYMVDTYICDSKVGCLLLKQQENVTVRPIGYWSVIPTRAKQKLAATHKEFVAIIEVVLLLRSFPGLCHGIARMGRKALIKAAYIGRCFREATNMATTTSRIRLQSSPPRKRQAPSVECTVKA